MPVASTHTRARAPPRVSRFRSLRCPSASFENADSHGGAFPRSSATTSSRALTSIPARVVFFIEGLLDGTISPGSPDPVPLPTDLVDAGFAPQILRGMGKEGGGSI
jgi:hypothetical protein